MGSALSVSVSGGSGRRLVAWVPGRSAGTCGCSTAGRFCSLDFRDFPLQPLQLLGLLSELLLLGLQLLLLGFDQTLHFLEHFNVSRGRMTECATDHRQAQCVGKRNSVPDNSHCISPSTLERPRLATGRVAQHSSLSSLLLIPGIVLVEQLAGGPSDGGVVVLVEVSERDTRRRVQVAKATARHQHDAGFVGNLEQQFAGPDGF